MKLVIYSLFIVFPTAVYASSTCDNPYLKSAVIQEILNTPQFQEALQVYEEAGHNIVALERQHEVRVALIKHNSRIADAAAEMGLASQSRVEISETLLSNLSDTILSTSEQIKPWKRKLKMAEGMLMYYQGKLEEAGYTVYFMKTKEAYFDPINPEQAEARLFGETEFSRPVDQNLFSHAEGRFFIMNNHYDLFAADGVPSKVIETSNVVAITYAKTFSEFIGINHIVDTTKATPRIVQVNLTYGPEGYVSSQLMANDFIEVCQ